MYHSISEVPKGEVMRSLHVTPNAFARQMSVLNLMGFRGLSMRDLAPYLSGEKQGKVVGLTFDDGYKNTLFTASPILQRLGFTATCYFVSDVSDEIGGVNRWDQSKGIAENQLMSEREIGLWHRAGHEVGAHTCSHINLEHASDEVARAEILESKTLLENLIHGPVDSFCYPYGAYSSHHVSMVEKAGFRNATTMRRGRAKPGENSYELPRIPINNRTSLINFVQKILTAYEDRRG